MVRPGAQTKGRRVPLVAPFGDAITMRGRERDAAREEGRHAGSIAGDGEAVKRTEGEANE